MGSEDYGVLFENPRRGRGGRFVKGRRRRASRRRKNSSRRRRSGRRRSRRRNPAIMASNPPRARRRRRSISRRRASSRRRRSSGRRRSYRRNPFGLKLGGGNIGHVMKSGLGIVGAELVGDGLARVATKFGVSKLFDAVKVKADLRLPLLRIGLGLFAAPLLRMLKFLPSSVTTMFPAINVASGVIGLTAGLRSQVFAKVGLGDYELADVLVGDSMGDYELADEAEQLQQLGDYELADVLVGDMHDQDYYGHYEARS